jgi:hypothetical protein
MCLTAMPLLVGAQINGVIADTIGGRRVPGAVITALDAERKVVKRALADDSGRFSIDNVPSVRHLRIVKIGYRPTERTVSPPASLRIAMERLPNLLEAVRTSDQPRCSRNATRPAAFGLWEQARAALLGTVIARANNSAMVKRANFSRQMSPRNDEILSQSVYHESSLSLRSFEAVYPAAELFRGGFVDPIRPGTMEFYGPDAEVLLDDALVEHYCLELADKKAERPTQVGLRFRPMGRQRGRVDLDGTLWIDTLTRTLTDIEFLYLGLESWANRLRPGGTISFHETSPTTVWIDQWWIRMTGAEIDRGQRSLPHYSPSIREAGAELVSAHWPDGTEWHGTFAQAALNLVKRDGSPYRNVRVQLDSTDYVGITDSIGRVVIDDLLPGPYRVSVWDSTLAVVDTALPGSTRFTAIRAKMIDLLVAAPTLKEFVTDRCVEQDAFSAGSNMLIARIVVGRDTLPMARTKWQIEAPAGQFDPLVPSGIYAHGETGSEGMVYFCDKLTAGKRVVLRAWSPRERAEGDGTTVTVTLRQPITAVKLAIPR